MDQKLKDVRSKGESTITVPGFERKSPVFTAVAKGICARLVFFEIFGSDPQRRMSSEVTKFADDMEGFRTLQDEIHCEKLQKVFVLLSDKETQSQMEDNSC